MPYYIDSNYSVTVTLGNTPSAGRLIPRDLGIELRLSDGHRLTPEQAAIVDSYLGNNLTPDQELLLSSSRGQSVMTAPTRSLPPNGTWSYSVVPVSEAGGLATAKGTAARMEETLSHLAAQGWELVTTTERDSRWLGSETVMLVVRRFTTTHAQFSARFEAEERLRRSIIQRLNSDATSLTTATPTQ